MNATSANRVNLGLCCSENPEFLVVVVVGVGAVVVIVVLVVVMVSFVRLQSSVSQAQISMISPFSNSLHPSSTKSPTPAIIQLYTVWFTSKDVSAEKDKFRV